MRESKENRGDIIRTPSYTLTWNQTSQTKDTTQTDLAKPTQHGGSRLSSQSHGKKGNKK